MPTRFRRSTRRLMMLVGLLPLAVLVMGSIYMLVMEHLEGSPRTFLESMQWATETLGCVHNQASQTTAHAR